VTDQRKGCNQQTQEVHHICDQQKPEVHLICDEQRQQVHHIHHMLNMLHYSSCVTAIILCVCVCVCVRVCVCVCVCIHAYMNICTHTHIYIYMCIYIYYIYVYHIHYMSNMLHYSSCAVYFSLFYRAILQKRPIILRSSSLFRTEIGPVKLATKISY